MTMTHDEINKINEKVIDILSTQLDVDPKEVIPPANLALELGADSLDSVAIAQSCEEAFAIVIADEESDAVRTVADLIILVEQKVKEKEEK